MNNVFLKWIFFILLFFTIGWFSSRQYYYKPITQIEIHDTIRVDSIRIIEKTKLVNVTTFDTTYLWKHDTITDTIRLEIPIEHKEYIDTFRTDTSEIDLKVSYEGFKTQINDININYHYIKEMPLNEKKWHIKPSFNVGVGFGYGAGSREGIIRFEPQVGIYGTVGFSILKY